MKTKWILIGIAVAGLGFTFIAHSQEATPPPVEKVAEGEPPQVLVADPSMTYEPQLVQVRVQVEYVEMSHEALTKLLFLAKPASADATKLREQVQEMVARNEAEVLETQMMVAKSGRKATSGSHHEFIYPTEYEPPQLAGSFDSSKKTDQPKSNVDAPFTPPTPTAFDTRNLGGTLEIEPTVGEGDRLIDLRLEPELAWHTGNTVWHDGKDGFGNPTKIQMPDFYSVRLYTSVICISGQYTLAGVLSPKNDKGEVDMTRKLMVFVKCDVLPVK
jgi:hypothetical protein